MNTEKDGTAPNATSDFRRTNGQPFSEMSFYTQASAPENIWRKRNRWRRRRGNKHVSSKRYPGRNKHHNVARCLGGSDDDWNLILLKVERHNLLHKIFGVRTLKEIIAVLERLDRMKERQKKRRAA